MAEAVYQKGTLKIMSFHYHFQSKVGQNARQEPFIIPDTHSFSVKEHIWKVLPIRLSIHSLTNELITNLKKLRCSGDRRTAWAGGMPRGPK